MKRRHLRHNLNDVKATTESVTMTRTDFSARILDTVVFFQRFFVISLPYFIQFDTTLKVMYRHEIICTGNTV